MRLIKPKDSPIQDRRTGKLYYTNNDTWRLAVNRQASLYRLCELLEPYLKHMDRQADMHGVLENVKARGFS